MCVYCEYSREYHVESPGKSDGYRPSSIDPALLISASFGNWTKSILGGSSTLNYHIYNTAGTRGVRDHNANVNHVANTYSHTSFEQAFIQNIFLNLDPLIELDFQRVFDDTNSHFDILSLSAYSDWSASVLGQAEYGGIGGVSYGKIRRISLMACQQMMPIQLSMRLVMR